MPENVEECGIQPRRRRLGRLPEDRGQAFGRGAEGRCLAYKVGEAAARDCDVGRQVAVAAAAGSGASVAGRAGLVALYAADAKSGVGVLV